ncbi:MAG: RsmE family RNA methyltransferase [Candidatus Electryonea clarkiae]|nr:RsmE family RNA methyltransferase [Candidatus Electryonea clarkiae]MDP8287251.1 RsmE family RNA methyltransferase [Candidatus Electryonea clarkiae]
MAQLEIYYALPEMINEEKGIATLLKDEVNHLSRVRRANIRDRIMIIDGLGNAWSSIIAKMDKDCVTLELLEKHTDWREPPVRIHLGLGILKPAQFLDAVDLAVQTGVHEIIPLITKHVVAGWNESKAKRANLRAIAAAKQCGRGLIPGIKTPQPFEKWCIESRGDSLRCYCSQDGYSIRELKKADDIILAIGCEGGFDKEEEELLNQGNFIPISLGPRRLRSETAVAVALSGILSIYE